MNYTYGSLKSCVSRVRSKYIVHKAYTVRRSNFCSKSIPIHVLVHKYDLNFSYSISHFSWLTQAVSKGLVNHSSQKVSYSSIMIDPVIHGFNPNEVNFICTFMITQLSLLV